MANVTLTEAQVRIKRVHAIAPDLTSEDIFEAIKGALITKLGWARTHDALESGDLTIEVIAGSIA